MKNNSLNLSYCAIANLFAGNGGPACDIFLEIRD